MPSPPPSSTDSPTAATKTVLVLSPTKVISKGTLVGVAVGAGMGGAVVFIGAVIFFLWYRRKKKKEALLRFASGCPPLLAPKKDDITSNGWSQNWPLADEKVTLQATSNPLPPVVGSNLHVSSDMVGTSSQHFEKPYPSPGIVPGLPQGTFTYDELVVATDAFSDANLIGQGGFGYVHKGVLQNGKVVAVKQPKSGGGQGEREFRAEIETISHVHHRHLVSMFGYCINGDQRLLVYEFVPNNSLEFHLHGKGMPTINWSTRMRIAVGAAKGLAYLHEDCQPKIIHRDIKAANILLDESFEAKVADFGLAKHSLDTQTHVSTRVMGTFGYLAPEYASSGKLTDKSDVFSFGVVLLELITGHRPVDRTPSFYDDNIVDWAMPLLKHALEDGKYDILVDPKLQNDYDFNEMTRMIACAAVCVRHSARRRPRMSMIVRALEGNIPLDELNEGIPPGYSTLYASDGSSNYTSSQHQEDLIKFRKMVLENREMGSSEYSGLISDYDQRPSTSSTDGQKQEATNKVEPPNLENINEDLLRS